MFIADSWAPSGTVRSRSFSPYMSVLWLTLVLAVATIDWVSGSWAEHFIIFTVLWAMDWAYITIEVSVLFNAKVGLLASILINSSWAIDVVWWADGWTIR
jgi:hypothetical protein